MKLLRSTLVFSALTFLSRISGYARDMVQAIVFGASGLTDAFVVAYRIPNFLRRIFAEGAFAQAFVPVFSEAHESGDPQALKQLLDRVAGTLCAVVLVVTGIGMVAAPWIVTLFAPGYLTDPVRHDAAGDMLRITFPYLFFISMTALSGAVLNTHGRFALPALTPILHNLAVIAAALWLAPLLSVPVYALAWGVFAAGAIQLLVQIPALMRLGLLPRPRWGLGDPGVRRVLRLMGPAVLSASVSQINLLVGTAFASLLIAGSQTWLYLADRLLEFPIGMIGVALGTVLLPTLSRHRAAGDQVRYRGSSPNRASAGTCTSNWIAPAANTPQASAYTGTASSGASHSAAAITARLCRIGVNAGTAKRLKLFNTPPANATIEMKNRYGNVMRSMSPAAAWRIGSSA